MKKCYLLLLMTLFCFCSLQAQETFFDSVKNLATKFGLDAEDESSNEKLLEYCKMFVEQYNALEQENKTSTYGLRKSAAQRDGHDDFTNRVRFPDISKTATPKYYYLKNVKTGEYLSFAGADEAGSDSYESPLYTVEKPDENSKFYFVPGKNQLGYTFYLRNLYNGDKSLAFYGPGSNEWKSPSTNSTPRFYFNVSPNKNGFYISDASIGGVIGEDGSITCSIGNVWTPNADNKIVNVYGEVRPEAVWVAEPIADTYATLQVANDESYDETDVVWYVLRNVGNGGYLHYEGSGASMTTVAAPDSCSLFYASVTADGKAKMHNYVAGDLKCAGVDAWNSEGVLFDVIPTNEDGDETRNNDSRFYMSPIGLDGNSDGYFAVENGKLVLSTESGANSAWEFERVTNFKEILGYCSNHGNDLAVDVTNNIRDIIYKNDANLTELYTAILEALLIAGEGGNKIVCESIASMKLFALFQSAMQSFEDGNSRILKYSGIYNSDHGYMIPDEKGVIRTSALTTNGSSLIANGLDIVVTEPNAAIMDVFNQVYQKHGNMWEFRITDYYDGSSLLSSSKVRCYFHNMVTGNYLTAPCADGNGGYVVGMTPNKSNAGFYRFDNMNLSYDGASEDDIMKIVNGYYTPYRFQSFDHEDVYLCLENPDDFVITCVETTNPDYVEGVDWFLITASSVIDEKVYKHAVDATEMYPEFLQKNMGLAKDCDYYSTNHPSEKSDYRACNLLDSDVSTVFWTETNSELGEAKHYIQADLGEAVKGFYFYMKPNLQTPYNVPVSITVEGSNSEDGGFVTLSSNIEMPDLLYDMYYFSDIINENGTAYQYLRFTVNSVNGIDAGGDDAEFTLSEFYIYPAAELVAQAKKEIDAFYYENYIAEDIVAPAITLMKRKAEYLLEVNKNNHAQDPAPGQYSTSVYNALEEAYAQLDEEDRGSVSELADVLDLFTNSIITDFRLSAVYIAESAWEESRYNGLALSWSDFDEDIYMEEVNPWDIRQWVKVYLSGKEMNPHRIEPVCLNGVGNSTADLTIKKIYGWNSRYSAQRDAFNITEEFGDYTTHLVPYDYDGLLSVSAILEPATPDKNKNAAWYLNYVADVSEVDYVNDSGFVLALAQFGKTMAQAEYLYNGEKAGLFVYDNKNNVTLKQYGEVFNALKYYYDMGPVKVVGMYNNGSLTNKDANDVMSQIAVLESCFPNFVLCKGYFRLRGEVSGNYLMSEADGTTGMAPKYDSDGTVDKDVELKSILFSIPSEVKLNNASILSYESGRYMKVQGIALKYDVLPEDGKEYDFQSAFYNVSSKSANLGGYYLLDNATKVGILDNYSDSYYDENTRRWDIEFVNELPVVISSAKFATFYAPVELQIPTGVTAYVLYGESEAGVGDYNIATGNSVDKGVNVFKVKPVEGGVIPAELPVILQVEKEGTYYFKINYLPTLTTEEEKRATYCADGENVTNLLEGRHAATYIPERAGYTHYILANKDKGVGMYKVRTYGALRSKDGMETNFENLSFMNNAHRAWLPMPNAVSQRAAGYVFSIGGGGDVTEIADIAVEKSGVEDMIFDLQGRRLESITRPGVYIVNGQRVFVK